MAQQRFWPSAVFGHRSGSPTLKFLRLEFSPTARDAEPTVLQQLNVELFPIRVEPLPPVRRPDAPEKLKMAGVRWKHSHQCGSCDAPNFDHSEQQPKSTHA